MPDQTLDQLNELLDANDADLLYTTRDGLDYKTKRGAIVDGLVEETRQVNTGAGLSGGGDLTADRTISLNVLGLPENEAPVLNADYVLIHETAANAPRRVRLDRLPVSPLQQNTFLNVAVAGQPTIVADGNTDTLNIAAGANISLTTSSVTDTVTIAATGLVPTTRNIGAGAGLSGGGDLTANRSFAVNIDGQAEDAAPTLANHFLLSHDSTTGTLKKLRASLLGGSSYTLPIATGSTLGGVRIGSGLAVDGNGVVTLNYTMPIASSVSLGGVKVGANLAISGDGTISGNPQYSLPVASAGTLGGVRVGSGLTIDGAGVLSAPTQGGTSYTLPVATTTTLGGVKQGANVTIAGDGAISVAAPYSLPVASAGALGGIRIGTGLAVDGSGIVSVTSGSSYTLPAATASVLGGVKIGSGVVVGGDGTISVPPTGATPNDGVIRPVGVVKGAVSAAQRTTNRNAIQAAITALNSQGSGKVALGGGRIEIAGELAFTGGHNGGAFKMFDGEGATLYQFSAANILFLSGCRHQSFYNLELIYSQVQTGGLGFDYTVLDPTAAVRLRDSMMNQFQNITIRNAWIGICLDTADPSGQSGGGSYSNVFTHIEINMAANTGWGYAQRRGTGNVINNMYITGNGQDIPCRGGVIMLAAGQTTFNQLNVEWLKAQKPLRFSNCYGVVINSPNLEGNLPLVTNSGAAALVHLDSQASVMINGGTISARFDKTTNGVDIGLIFSIHAQSKLEVHCTHIAQVEKTGAVRTILVGCDNALNVVTEGAYASFYNINLRRSGDINHYNLDDLCVHPIAANNEGHGPLRVFNNVIGGATGGWMNWGDDRFAEATNPGLVTIYYHGPWQRINVPLTANRTWTLHNRIEANTSNTNNAVARVPRGAVMRLTRGVAATGAFTLTVNNFNGTALTTLAINQTAEFLFDGTNWVMFNKY